MARSLRKSDDHPLRGNVRVALYSQKTTCIHCFSAFLQLLDDSFQVEVRQISQDHELEPTVANACDLIIVLAIVPDMGDLSLTEKLVKRHPDIPLIVHSESEETETVIRFFDAGVKGYLNADMNPDLVHAALTLVLNGSSYVPPSVLEGSPQDRPQTFISADNGPSPAFSRETLLTGRQEDVLELISRGLSNKAIAKELSLAEPTIKAHVRQLMLKLNVSNRTQLALFALSQEGEGFDRA